jgi:hypothetical protein
MLNNGRLEAPQPSGRSRIDSRQWGGATYQRSNFWRSPLPVRLPISQPRRLAGLLRQTRTLGLIRGNCARTHTGNDDVERMILELCCHRAANYQTRLRVTGGRDQHNRWVVPDLFMLACPRVTPFTGAAGAYSLCSNDSMTMRRGSPCADPTQPRIHVTLTPERVRLPTAGPMAKASRPAISCWLDRPLEGSPLPALVASKQIPPKIIAWTKHSPAQQRKIPRESWR